MAHPHQAKLEALAREHGGTVSVELDGDREVLVYDCPPGRSYMGSSSACCSLAERVYDSSRVDGVRERVKDRFRRLDPLDGA